MPLRDLLPADPRFRWLLSGGLAAVVAVSFVGAAVAYPRLTGSETVAAGPTSQPSAGTTAAAVTGSQSPSGSAESQSPSSPPSTGSSGGGTNAGGGGNSGGGNSGGGGGGTQPSATNGPQIQYFRIKQPVHCPRANDPGQPLILEWHATGGVTKIAMSVDNPGLVGSYDTYSGPDGSATFTNFGCPQPAGTKQSHTFTIYTIGGGTQRSKSLTVTATSQSLTADNPPASGTP